MTIKDRYIKYSNKISRGRTYVRGKLYKVVKAIELATLLKTKKPLVNTPLKGFKHVFPQKDRFIRSLFAPRPPTRAC